MSNIIPFLRNGKKPHHRKDDGTVVKVLTIGEIYQEVFEQVVDDWRKFAVKNRLNEFIISKIPDPNKSLVDIDYTCDLNALSALEQKFNIKVSLFWPECTSANPYGWIAGFHKDGVIFTTPSDMSSEAYARALNILLYLGLEHRLLSMKSKF